MSSFLTESEQSLCDAFLENGIVKIEVEDAQALGKIQEKVIDVVYAEKLGDGHQYTLDQLHERISWQDINYFRLHVIERINDESWFRPAYYSLARAALNAIVGNELVMQRRINLSIQLPGDESSLLPIHCDTWSGDSPYEVVLWVPLVDCYGTKSMFFCDAKADAAIQPNISQYQNAEELYQAIAPHAQFMEVKYGEALIFTQNVMHGNRANATNETRWSLNCRFKSALSPYADKKLGEFFEPITIRPATKWGMKYEYPRI